MLFLPICVNIESQMILVIGGGTAAFHKISSVLKYTTLITAIAPRFSEPMLQAPVQRIQRPFHISDLDDAFLVYAATDDRELNAAIVAEAQNRNILVNVCDDPSLSTFVSPAIFRQGHMSVAVSSNGSDVKKSVEWRNRIQEYLQHD